ncbi:MAG: SMC-Scp complex subunit ScpB [Clostridia bacterium]|nr:SMC-Scp complex subunit ScpB [Clostridia bacterium]
MEENVNLKEIIFSILFVAGEGIEKSFIAEKLNISEKKVEEAIEELKKDYTGEKGIHIISYKKKVQLASNQAYASYISDVLNPIREKHLTRAALETLAIIAYKQPITRLDIEDIRKSSSDYAVQILLDQNMIEVVGRKDAVGKPLLFGTTETFLKRFNLEDINNLPSYEDLLERIRVIRDEPKEDKGDSLFNFPDKEEIPDFLKDETDLVVEGDIEVNSSEPA